MTDSIGTTKLRLTNRGKVVVGILLTALLLALFSYADRVTTPEACRVPTEQMTQECLDTMFPN